MEAPYIAKSMTFIYWSLWFFNINFTTVVLLNFLIAYVSQSHEYVLETKISNMFQQKCLLNKDYFLYYNAKVCHSFILSTSAEMDHNDDTSDINRGIIRTVKQQVNESKNHIISKLTQTSKELSHLKNDIEDL